jgi:hypothetical protein
MAGMSPNAIKDPEQRKAYEDAIDKRNADELTRSWLIQAKAAYRLSFERFDRALKAAVQRGITSDEKRNSALAAAKRQTDE